MTTRIRIAIGLLIGLGLAYSGFLDVPTSAQRTASTSGTLSVQDACVSLDVEGLGTASVDITGSWTGTISFYVEGRGLTRNAARMTKADSSTTVTTTTANGVWSGPVAGYKTFLACFTTASSGTARIEMSAAGTGGGAAGSTSGTIALVDGDNDPLTDDPNNALKVSVVAGAASGTTDTDDATVAAGQATLALGIAENYWFDGTNWKRLTFGTAGTASAQVLTVQGVASMTPVIVTATNLDIQSGGADLLTETTGAGILTSTNYAAAFGTAGTADSQVMSVQGIASMTPLQVQSNSANIATQTTLASVLTDTTAIKAPLVNASGPLAGAATATAMLAAGGQYNLTPPTLTDGQQAVLQVSSDGSLKVTGGGGGTEYVVNAVAPANPTGNAPVMERDDALSALAEVEGDWTNLRSNANGALWVTVDGTATVDLSASDTLGTVTTVGTVSTVTTLSQFGGNAITLGAGNAGAGSLNVVLATNQAALVGLGIYTEDAAETAGGNLSMAGSVRRDTAASSAGTTGDNATINTDAVGRLWTSGATTEDTASAGGDQLIAIAAIRDDTLDARSGTEGDYEMLHLNANGALWVIDVNSITLVSMIGVEDAAETSATGLAMAGTVRRDTAASSAGTTGDNATLNTDSIGRLWITGSAVEDAAETAAGILNMVGTVRRDTAASSAGTTGDNATLNTDAVGALWVNPFSQTQAAATYLTVRLSDGSGFITPGTDYTHDAALTIASTAGPAIVANYDDSSPDSVDEGDAGVLRISANRNLYTTIRDAAGNERGVNVTASNELLVNCSNCTGSGASGVDDAAFGVASGSVAPAGYLFDDVAPDSVNEGDLGLARMSANRNVYVTLRDAAGNERGLNVDSSGRIDTTISVFPDNEPFNVQQWGGTNVVNGGTAGSVAIGGVQDHDAAISGNKPVLLGLEAKDFDGAALPNVVSAEGDLTRLAGSLYGVQYVMIVNEDGSLERGTSTTPFIVSDGSGALNVIVDSGTVTTVSTVTTLSQLGGVALPIEDAAETAGGVGIYAMAVRRDTAASSSTTDGDNSTLNTDANGKLWVNAGGVTLTVASHAVTNAGTFAVQVDGNALTSLQLIDDAVFTDDAAFTPATSKGLIVGGQADDTSTDSVDEGDFGAFRISLDRLLYTRQIDPCSGVAKTHIPINISTATTTEITAALAGAGNNYYICSLDLVTAGANNVALVDDDTDNCGSVTSGLAGGTTAASGWNFAANGGIVKGTGNAQVYKTGGTNRVICIVTSAATQLSGSIDVVAAP